MEAAVVVVALLAMLGMSVLVAYVIVLLVG